MIVQVTEGGHLVLIENDDLVQFGACAFCAVETQNHKLPVNFDNKQQVEHLLLTPATKTRKSQNNIKISQSVQRYVPSPVSYVLNDKYCKYIIIEKKLTTERKGGVETKKAR